MSPPCEKEAIGCLQGESTCDGVEAPKPLLLEHIVRLYRNSECRTPLISLRSCGDPLPTLRWLAAAQGLSVWSIVLDSQKAEQNALDYLEVGFKNGDWVCLHVLEQVPCEATLRQIALLLMTLEPEPELYPKREMFRLWLTLDTMDFDINDHIRSPLPTLLRKNALYGTRRECDDENMSCPHRTTVKKLEAVEPTLYTQSLSHRQDRLRRTQRPPECEEDSGSDMEEPEAKLTGLWFHRHAELHDPSHTAVSSHHHSFVTFDGAGLTDQSLRYLELLFRAIQCGLYDDAVGVIESTLQQYEGIVTSSELLNRIWRQGRTPLMWSVLYGRMRITTYLLEHGADPNVVAQSTACPLLFMGLETVEELELLLKFRLDTDVMFEGKTFAEHPNSSPILIKYLKQKEC